MFQLLLKECTIEADVFGPIICYFRFQLLLKECTIEAEFLSFDDVCVMLFQLLLKECTIEARTAANMDLI